MSDDARGEPVAEATDEQVMDAPARRLRVLRHRARNAMMGLLTNLDIIDENLGSTDLMAMADTQTALRFARSSARSLERALEAIVDAANETVEEPRDDG